MEVIELTKKLVGIGSATFEEKEIADFLFDFLKENNFNVLKQEVSKDRYNILACSGDFKKARLLLNGHLDTVPVGDIEKWKKNPYGELSGSKLYGRGSCDMKGAIAAMITAGIGVMNTKKDFMFVFTVGEETGNFDGGRTFVKHKFPAVESCIIGEPTSLKLIIGHKGGVSLKVTVKGKACHASMPEKGKNAIYDAIEAIAAVRKLRENTDVNNALLGKPTINIGTIKGGTATNVVPDYCEFSIDTRTVPPEDSKKVAEQIKKVLRNHKVEINCIFDAFETPETSRIVTVAKEVLEKNKLFPETLGVSYGTEAFIYSKAGIKSIILGPGDIKNAHVIDEYININELKKAVKIYKEIIINY